MQTRKGTEEKKQTNNLEISFCTTLHLTLLLSHFTFRIGPSKIAASDIHLLVTSHRLPFGAASLTVFLLGRSLSLSSFARLSFALYFATLLLAGERDEEGRYTIVKTKTKNGSALIRLQRQQQQRLTTTTTHYLPAPQHHRQLWNPVLLLLLVATCSLRANTQEGGTKIKSIFFTPCFFPFLLCSSSLIPCAKVNPISSSLRAVLLFSFNNCKLLGKMNLLEVVGTGPSLYLCVANAAQENSCTFFPPR